MSVMIITRGPCAKQAAANHKQAANRRFIVAPRCRTAKSSRHDLFPGSVPVQCPPLAVTVHRHPCRDGHSIPQFQRAVGLFSGADAVQEILHVSGLRTRSLSHDFGAGWTVYLLRQISDRLVHLTAV